MLSLLLIIVIIVNIIIGGKLNDLYIHASILFLNLYDWVINLYNLSIDEMILVTLESFGREVYTSKVSSNLN